MFTGSKIAYRLALIVGLVGLTLAILHSAISAYYDLETGLKRMEESTQRILEASATSASQAVYELNQETADHVLTGLLHFDFIVSAQIKDELDQVLATLDKQPASSHSGFPLSELIAGGEQEYILELTNPVSGAANFGQLSATVDSDSLLDPLLRPALIRFILGIFGALLLIVVILYITRHQLTGPLVDLDRAAQSLARGEWGKPINSPRHDELGHLANSFDTMAGQLHEMFTHLEEQVAERTQDLQIARDEAETANKAKSLFLANMSHDLRTPLNAILGFSEMLGHSRDISATHLEQLAIINRSGENLLNMIDAILDLARIDAGRMSLELEAFDLPLMLEEIGDVFKLRAEDVRLYFNLELDPELAPYIKTDLVKLRQILNNLLGNAVKFTCEGGLSLRVRTLPMTDDPARVMLQLEVQDSGPGITEEQQLHIFDHFTRGNIAGINSSRPGLGLTVSKSLVELLDGEISLDSAPGEGSLFRINIPVSLAESVDVGDTVLARPEVLGLAPGQDLWRVLVVDDIRENRLLLNNLLAKIGFEVDEAENGAQAVSLFEERQPHFIWMDVRMPVMDGYQATEKIRKLPGGDAVKIVAVTTSIFANQSDAIHDAGFDEVVYKPFRAHKIYDAMSQQLGVSYIHGEQDEAVQQMPTISLTVEMLTDLPGHRRRALKQAAEILDVTGADEVIEQIRSDFPDTAIGLSQLVHEYRFSEILELLREVEHIDA